MYEIRVPAKNLLPSPPVGDSGEEQLRKQARLEQRRPTISAEDEKGIYDPRWTPGRYSDARIEDEFDEQLSRMVFSCPFEMMLCVTLKKSALHLNQADNEADLEKAKVLAEKELEKLFDSYCSFSNIREWILVALLRKYPSTDPSWIRKHIQDIVCSRAVEIIPRRYIVPVLVDILRSVAKVYFSARSRGVNKQFFDMWMFPEAAVCTCMLFG
jgi:hypothetical protein